MFCVYLLSLIVKNGYIQGVRSLKLSAAAVPCYYIVPRLSRKQGTLNLIHSSFRLSVRLSVTKTLTWLISSEVLMIEH